MQASNLPEAQSASEQNASSRPGESFNSSVAAATAATALPAPQLAGGDVNVAPSVATANAAVVEPPPRTARGMSMLRQGLLSQLRHFLTPQEGNANVPTSVTAANLEASAPNPQSAEETKVKLVQLQLVLLIHAYQCRSEENQATGEANQCELPYCSTMKHAVNHMDTCQAGKFCTVLHCASSFQIISHFKNCSQIGCPVCAPLKIAADRRQRRHGFGPILYKQKLGA